MKTRPRPLNKDISVAFIEEKYQITTLFDIDEEGAFSKPKIVKRIYWFNSLSIV